MIIIKYSNNECIIHKIIQGNELKFIKNIHDVKKFMNNFNKIFIEKNEKKIECTDKELINKYQFDILFYE